MSQAYPALADLGLIGDRRTAALIGRDATVWWHSPHRFDGPSLFNALLDPAKGAWRVLLPGAAPGARRYIGDSAVLETELAGGGAALRVTDWLTIGRAARPGLFCRSLSPAPRAATVLLEGWREEGRRRARPALVDGAVVFEDGLHLFASHPLRVDERGAAWVLPEGEPGWTVLADGPCDPPRTEQIEAWRKASMARWSELAALNTYDGPYREAAAASLRQLRLLVFEPTGAIAAAATAGLPEVIGGERNYDYRYAWLRDTAMAVRALLKTAQGTGEGEAFLDFVALTREHARRRPLDALSTVDARPVGGEHNPPLAGYRDSRPVRIGNRAGKQLQLGAFGLLLLAAATLFREGRSRKHWDVIEEVADFLAADWRKPDSGIWESPQPRQYTASKVFAACGLEAVAPFAPPVRRNLYRREAQAIRRFVRQRCLTREGAFAAFAGCGGVDISAALFPLWGFCAPDAPEMEASLTVLRRGYERGGLFRREDETPQSRYEGAFLAGTFWMAQYWTSRGDAGMARHYIEAGLAQANDLGLLPEEVDWQTGAALGNLPLGLCHASFLNAAADLATLERDGG